MTRAISQQSRTIRLPIHVTDQLNKVKRAQRHLSQQLGRKPSLFEVSQELNLKPEKIREYLLMATKPISLDIRLGDTHDTELQELLEDDRASPEDFIIHQALCQDIQAMLSELPAHQQEIISLRFGLNDGVPLSLVKVGERMGISRERVRQLEGQALKSLHRKKAKIKGYLTAS
jgi:RNA polymerase nonessential primary-like sigma factor